MKILLQFRPIIARGDAGGLARASIFRSRKEKKRRNAREKKESQK